MSKHFDMIQSQLILQHHPEIWQFIENHEFEILLWWNGITLAIFLEMFYQANHTTGNNKLSEQDDIKEN